MKKSVVLFLFSLLGMVPFSSWGDAASSPKQLVENFSEEKDPPSQEDQYTINYNNVPILEYLRFVSKICSTNFLFNAEELQFKVSVVSKEPILPSNVMATLMQILRIHGFSLLEQDGNLVIHKNEDVKQAAKIIGSSEPIPLSLPIITRLFRVKNANVDSLAAIIRPMTSKDALLEVSTATRHIILTDIPANIKKIEDLILAIDSPQNPLEIEIYKTKNNPPAPLTDLTQKIISPLSEGTPFILVPQESTGSIFVVSTPRLIEKALSILNSLDVSSVSQKKALGTDNVFIYKLQNRTKGEMEKSLQDLIKNLKETGYSTSDLLETLSAHKWVQDTHSLLFTGNKDTLAKIKELLTTLDFPSQEKLALEKESFFIYKPNYRSAQDIASSLKEIGENLKTSGDSSLISMISSVKIVDSTKSLLFTGDAASFTKVKELLAAIDLESYQGISQVGPINFYLYTPQSATKDQIKKYLSEVASQLEKSDIPEKPLISTLQNMKWIDESSSFLFVGPEPALTRLKEILGKFDSPEEQKKISTQSNYFLYKLQNVSGSVIEEDLDRFTEKLKSQGIAKPQFLEVIDQMKWVKETNSLLLTGSPAAIEEVKALISKYDVPRKEKLVLPHGNFFLYKPEFLSAELIQKSIRDISDNLEKAELSDPNFLNALRSVKYVSSTNSFVFTGSEESLQKIKGLLKTIDLPSDTSLPKEEKTTFFIYKVLYAPVQQITSSLHAIVSDLKKTGSSDTAFLLALESIKYQKNTNSLLFTGTPAALEKIKLLLEKFDVSAEEAKLEGPDTFFIYKPKYLSGPALEASLQDFATHLKLSGFTKHRLYQTIGTMKWDEKNHQLIFTGDAKSIEEIKDLLGTFDLPGELDGGIPVKDLQSIDNTTFLVYKLQFHKGDEIQAALQKIGKDLLNSKTTVKESLLNSINSIQWIEITNSLLCSGDQETMTRLKDLIRNLDIPLKQVFIEMLVIETSLTNVLDFGLDWGSKLKYRDKFVSSVSNIQPIPSGGSLGGNALNLNNINQTNTPNGSSINFGSGFDLGIIGDVIMHKGQSFWSLGSLLTALKQDAEFSIVMTPKVITQDGKTSTIFIGRNIPYIASQTTITGAGGQTTQNLDYQDIGMNLTLTPFLGNSDTVTLTIDLQNSAQLTDSAGNTVSSTTTGTIAGITTSKTTMNTTVHIPDRNFLILTGMVQDHKFRDKSGIPCLGGLPYIGAAFSRTNKLQTKDNLVIFIRPHIINSYKDMISYTEAQKDIFQEQAGSKSLEKDIEEAYELGDAGPEEE